MKYERVFSKRRPPAGSAPGKICIDSKGSKPRIYVIDYGPDHISELDIYDLDGLAEYADRNSVTWIDVQGLGDADVLKRIAQIFSIHPLAFEDLVNVPSRPKADQYDEHLLYITNLVSISEAKRLKVEQLGIVIGRNFVITFHEKMGDILTPVRDRIRIQQTRLRKSANDYLAYAIIDAVIDRYYPALETLGDHLENLEQEVLTNFSRRSIEKIYSIKRDLLTLRRVVWPERESLAEMIREDTPFIGRGVSVYFRDCYDHCIQAMDVIETYRELCSGLTDLCLSGNSNRMNEIMKVLTMIATIFIPLSFLAGIYGMNFDYMPELRSKWGYPVFLLVCFLLGAGMVHYFVRRGWIGRSDFE